MCFSFSDSYLNAQLGAKARVDDSNYETEKEFGVGKRKRKTVQRISSDEDEENVIIHSGGNGELKKKVPALPSAPIVHLPNNQEKVLFSAKKTDNSPIKIVGKKRQKRGSPITTILLKLSGKTEGQKPSRCQSLRTFYKKRNKRPSKPSSKH